MFVEACRGSEGEGVEGGHIDIVSSLVRKLVHFPRTNDRIPQCWSGLFHFVLASYVNTTQKFPYFYAMGVRCNQV